MRRGLHRLAPAWRALTSFRAPGRARTVCWGYRQLCAMKHVFDQVASRFARSIDGTMRAGYYARGSHFIGLARHAFPGRGYVLDFGCGPGRLSLLLADAGFRVLGVDISHGMIAEARQLDTRGLPIEFASIDRAEEALVPSTYDGIVCSSVIEYVADADSLLQGFRHSLRKPGCSADQLCQPREHLSLVLEQASRRPIRWVPRSITSGHGGNSARCSRATVSSPPRGRGISSGPGMRAPGARRSNTRISSARSA